MHSPKAPAPTRDEQLMRTRQVEELTRLDEEENRRLKGLTRSRLGGRSLLSGRGSSSGGSKASGKTATAAGASGGSGQGYANWSGAGGSAY